MSTKQIEGENPSGVESNSKIYFEMFGGSPEEELNVLQTEHGLTRRQAERKTFFWDKNL